jgi:Arm DNA-binding domain
MLVKPGGSKLWWFRYRFAGRENMLSLGACPAVSLANARGKRNEARKLLAAATDPSRQRKLDKYASAAAAQNTFESIAAECLGNMEAQKASERTISKNRWLLEKPVGTEIVTSGRDNRFASMRASVQPA